MAGSTTVRGRMLRPGLVTASELLFRHQITQSNTVKYIIELGADLPDMFLSPHWQTVNGKCSTRVNVHLSTKFNY